MSRNRVLKMALATAFGVIMAPGLISGIPASVPGLARTLSCSACKVELKGGLPSQFSQYMTAEQRKKFRAQAKLGVHHG